jgi:glyoxylase-like metal-dependent hydrolase (beta-lactamase superfamily II)/rhodanese-related sulfurtransferase
MMILEQYYIECLSQASYLIGDETTGRAVVVDPRRDIADYLADADSKGLTIEGVINTHFHADFVAGHLELAEATGAWIGMGEAAQTDYPIRRLAHGQHIALGAVDMEILATPGHTWESISVLVRDCSAAPPASVLTGDALFIGDVGRPDLANLGDGSTSALARALYRSIHERLLTLPDQVIVMPAHGAGSSCGKNLSTELTSTIGEQRTSNPSVQPMSEDEFVALVTEGQSAVPSYFPVAAAINRRARPPLDRVRVIPPMTPTQLRSALRDGVRVLDARSVDDFAAGHLRGSVNIGFDGRFAETAGMVTEIGEPIALVVYPGHEQLAAMRLARIGSDNVIGYLNIGRDVPFPFGLCDLVQSAPRITAGELDGLLAENAVSLIDIRNPGERERGAIAGALHIPLAQLRSRLGEVYKANPIVVHCASGWRSSVAASLLRESGFENVADLAGGYNAWVRARRVSGVEALAVTPASRNYPDPLPCKNFRCTS